MRDKKIIYLADLTHTGPVISSPIHPLGIGLLAAYIIERLGNVVDVELFKYPDDLSRALATRIPDIIGFSNYSWNTEIGFAYARRIKKISPATVTVFGGPNYGLGRQEMNDFWSRHEAVDFNIVGEGEIATVELVKTLMDYDFNVGAIRAERLKIPNCHYLADGEVVCGGMLARIKDISAMPSPYLGGLMDKFFDNTLIPMIETVRGCPFSCTYCRESAAYYNHISKKTDIYDELEYIAERIEDIPEMHISDSNFGMYREDVINAKQIRRIIDKYDWPKNIQVDSGKNNKKRLLECARIMKGRASVTAALQSTDPEILNNIGRSNIAYADIEEVGRKVRDIGVRSYIEIILGLPGDSREKHVKSLRDSVNSGIPTIRMYQLIMLPLAEMNSQEMRRKFAIKTKFRLMPRSFGRYSLLGDDFTVVESEEICIGNAGLSFDDYLEMRELHLCVEMLHNGDLFLEIRELCNYAGLDWFDIIMKFHTNRRRMSPDITAIFDTFREDNISGLWQSRERLAADISEKLDAHAADDMGTNEISKAKAVAWTMSQDQVHDAVYALATSEIIKQKELWNEIKPYLEQLKTFSMMRKRKFMEVREAEDAIFDFDFTEIMKKSFRTDPLSHKTEKPIKIVFRHSDEQAALIKGYIQQFGTTIDGIGRILMAAPVHRMLRSAVRHKGCGLVVSGGG